MSYDNKIDQPTQVREDHHSRFDADTTVALSDDIQHPHPAPPTETHNGTSAHENALVNINTSPLIGTGRIAGGTGPAPLPSLHRWPKSIKAFAHRDYRYIWSGALVSNLGSWMQNVAQAWLVFDLTKSSTWLGIDGFASGIPVLILLPLGGVIADRINRRWILVTTNLLCALNAAALAIMAATGFLTADRVGFIVMLSVFSGIFDALRIPANQSLVPAVVGREDTANAIALNSIQFNISRAAGPALAGLALVYLGVAWSFAFNSISFLAVIAAFLLMNDPPGSARKKESMMQSLKGGLRYVRSRHDLLVLMILVILGGLLAAPVSGKMLPIVAHDIYNGSAETYSQLVSCFGIGAVIGAIFMAVRSNESPDANSPWRAVPLYMLLGLCEAALAFEFSFPIGLTLVGIGGGAFVAAMVRNNTTIMNTSPDEVRGRVSSFQVMAFRTGMPIGALISGILAAGVGIRIVLWGAGIGLFIIVPLLALLARRFARARRIRI